MGFEKDAEVALEELSPRLAFVKFNLKNWTII